MTLSSTHSAVWWFGGWTCERCGASGEADWPDESVPHADHECDQADTTDDDVTWSGEWTCERCGAGGDAQWTDTESTYADHTCEDEPTGPVDGGDQDDDQEVAA